MKTGLSLALTLLLASATMAGAGDQAVRACLDRMDMVDVLVAEFGEQLVEVHPTSTGLLEFHVSPTEGSWTAVVTYRDGTSCVIAAGSNVDPSRTVLGEPFLEI